MYSAKAINKGQNEAVQAEKSLRLLKSKMSSRSNANSNGNYNPTNFGEVGQKPFPDNSKYNSNAYATSSNQYQGNSFIQKGMEYNPHNYKKNEMPVENDYMANLKRQMQVGIGGKSNMASTNGSEKIENQQFHDTQEFNGNHQKIKENNVKILKTNSNYVHENSKTFQQKPIQSNTAQPQYKQINIYDPKSTQSSTRNPGLVSKNPTKVTENPKKTNPYMKENKRIDLEVAEKQNKKVRTQAYSTTKPQPNKYDAGEFQTTQSPPHENRLPKNNQGYAIEKHIQPEEKPSKDIEMVGCRQGCGRSFNIESIEKHENVCKKVFQSKRKKFESKNFRKVDDQDFGFVLPTKKKAAPAKKKPQKDWKAESEAFRAMIKQAKGVPISQKEQDQMNLNYEKAQNLTQCSFCGRKFNYNAAEKHIPYCEKKSKDEMMKNKKPMPKRR